MKIAITGPHFWPYRRRGSAAYIFNLSNYLVRQGHKVEIITSKPGKPKIVNKGNMTITYLRYIQHPVLDGYNINRVHLFTLNCFVHLLRRNYDIVHCIYHPDGFSAYLQKMFKRLRYVLLVTTTPFTFHWKHSPIDPYMFKKAVTGAKRCVVPSCYARDCMKRDHDVDCELIPCGVDLQHFHVNTPKDLSTPRILCTAALHDERKRVPVLIKAFEFLVQGGTKAILQLAGETTPETNRRLLSMVDSNVRRSIQILPSVTYKQLPKLYASAALTVLPSISETFGMSLTESLACGTPAVGTRSGAIPEIINDPSVGTLFDTNDEKHGLEDPLKLYNAIRRTLELAKDPDTVHRCHQHARQYDWRKVGKKLQSLYERVLSGQP